MRNTLPNRCCVVSRVCFLFREFSASRFSSRSHKLNVIYKAFASQVTHFKRIEEHANDFHSRTKTVHKVTQATHLKTNERRKQRSEGIAPMQSCVYANEKIPRGIIRKLFRFVLHFIFSTHIDNKTQAAKYMCH